MQYTMMLCSNKIRGQEGYGSNINMMTKSQPCKMPECTLLNLGPAQNQIKFHLIHQQAFS
jgi:hypothetical protein